MAGRPSDYTPELAGIICDRIALGDSLRAICEADDMPGQTTVYRWLESIGEFREQYARAREAQAEHYADEIIEIADTDPDPTKARVRVDARKWAASKLAPKKYGDRVVHAGDEQNPVRVESLVRTIIDPAKHSDS